ncbi:response regulator transcription factor [Curtobacterium sp. ME26]|uniref:response regulator transcription factor n=1 Tax=Curtobacterium sp. ME26 TaxID=2744254 RepID=UPI001C70E9EA|nr:LuxR C-terminal-related transcriptional regulator [Curtobacterium sp. ME26]
MLGHLVEGCSNLEIARALAVAPRTVAAHVEHILFKLDATSRTLAAVRAERAGLYVPVG